MLKPRFEINNLFKILTFPDKILIIVVLITSVFSFFYIKSKMNTVCATIYYQQKELGTFSLTKDKIINIDKGIVVEIKNGKVRMKESTCKNKYCIKQGWSNSVPIVCLPNKVLIKFNSKRKMIITR